MKIILNIATHGDERIGEKVAKEIKKLNISKEILIVQVANKKAFALKKRFIDQDLNRSFPGKEIGNYEERRANELSPIIKSADVVIDIHSTTSGSKDTIIVTKINKKILECIKSIQPKYVLIMNATKNNSLISKAKMGIAFEYGRDGDELAIRKTVIGIKRLLSHFGIIHYGSKKTNTNINCFDVVSTIPKISGAKLIKKVKNYHLIKKGEPYAIDGNKKILAKDDFYPILFGERKYTDIFGFKGKKIKIL
jgi:predicted deacylase